VIELLSNEIINISAGFCLKPESKLR